MFLVANVVLVLKRMISDYTLRCQEELRVSGKSFLLR